MFSEPLFQISELKSAYSNVAQGEVIFHRINRIKLPQVIGYFLSHLPVSVFPTRKS